MENQTAAFSELIRGGPRFAVVAAERQHVAPLHHQAAGPAHADLVVPAGVHVRGRQFGELPADVDRDGMRRPGTEVGVFPGAPAQAVGGIPFPGADELRL